MPEARVHIETSPLRSAHATDRTTMLDDRFESGRSEVLILVDAPLVSSLIRSASNKGNNGYKLMYFAGYMFDDHAGVSLLSEHIRSIVFLHLSYHSPEDV